MQEADPAVYYQRVRLILCRAWGKTPPEIDRLIASGGVLLSDVCEALALESIYNPGIHRWLHAEEIAAREASQARVKDLCDALDMAKDPEYRAALAREIDQENLRWV